MFNLLKRLWSLFVGRAQIETDDTVKSNTDAAYSAKISELTEKVQSLRVASREMKGLQFDYEHQIKTLETEKKELQQYLDIAVDQENVDLGEELLEKIDVVDRAISDKKDLRDSYKAQADKLSSLLTESTNKLEKLKTERTEARGTMKLASAVRELNSETEQDSAADINLEVAREAVRSAKYQADAEIDSDQNSIDHKLKKLKTDASKTQNKMTMAELIAKKNASKIIEQEVSANENE